MTGDSDASGHRPVTDRLEVRHQSDGGVNAVERVDFDASGFCWDVVDFSAAPLNAFPDDDTTACHGRNLDDMPDAFTCRDDVLRLDGHDMNTSGTGTGHDTIFEGIMDPDDSF